MSCNPKFFLVTFDRLYNRVIEHLSSEELEKVTCYCVQKKVSKNISKKINNIVNEWELPWNNYEFQTKQYYEYGAMVHILQNSELFDNVTHIGLLHYDVIFNKNSINDMISELMHTPDTIFYQQRRPNNQTSLSFFEAERLCDLMSSKMGVHIDITLAWNNGWVSEALSLTPKNIFLNFAKFLHDNHLEIENILKTNKWGIMNICPHRICGIVERMWGFYLVGCGLPLKQMNVIHDWGSYQHHHMLMNGTGLTNL
jgi:hypothetical protein